MTDDADDLRLLARGSRTPCPQCGAVGTMLLERGLIAKPITAQSLAGAQLKTGATACLFIRCADCSWRAPGDIQDGKFVVAAYADRHDREPDPGSTAA